MNYDYLIIGSGFGGAVSALRLADKGWKVGVIEQGRRIGPAEIEAARARPLSELYWQPALGQRGHFAQHVFRHVSIVAGVGVGGGSLVWGTVMLEPKPAFYESVEVRALGIDLRTELAPHLETARQAFGVTRNPRHTLMDSYLQQTAQRMGAANSFGPVPNAIYFGEQGTTVADPYFGGAGPQRTGCCFCASCMTGCPYGSKNSLDYNYLYLAEQRGVKIHSETMASRIEPCDAGYRVTLRTTDDAKAVRTVTAAKLIIAAGVIGTLELLLRNRDEYRTLPGLSPRLGETVRTNSEAVVAVLHPPGTDLSDGTGISSDFYPNAHTHITQNRFHRNFRLMRFSFGPLVDGEQRLLRALKTLLAMFLHPGLMVSNWFGRDWEKRITILTVMQNLDDKIRFVLARPWWWPFRPRLRSCRHPDGNLRGYIPEANEAARQLAAVSGGRPLNNLFETLGGKTVTAHILGGCPIGADRETGVIDTRHEVHGYPGLYVVDGSSIPANIGVNPSLTIVAMAERFAALQPGQHPPGPATETAPEGAVPLPGSTTRS